jgi:VIT1/CCC1 family predicted Fe2+/Mn2+ transporter
MPLPSPPTRRLNNAVNRQADNKASNELLIKGALCALIGVAVLVSPHLIVSPGVQGVVAKAALVGWFALALGVAFIGVAGWRRLHAEQKP